jgi:MFS family permease
MSGPAGGDDAQGADDNARGAERSAQRAEGGARAAQDPASRVAALALAITLAIQIFTAVSATAVSVLAPEIGRDVGIAPKLVGVFVGILYAGSMLASLVSGMFIERHGAIRVSQVCVLLCVAGILTMAAGTALSATTLISLAIAPVVIGLGYGPITPASSHILARTAHPSRMALTFSIKQTGVPAGAALAGAALPILTLQMGWHMAFAAVAVLGIPVVLLSELVRKSLDVDHASSPRPSIAGFLAPLRELVRADSMRELAITAFLYAALQVCLVSFIVVYTTETLRYSLVAAGLVLTVANVAGVVGRIAWGGFADFHLAPRELLGWRGLAAGLCAFATAGFGTMWPAAAILATSAIFGATAIGWNGVMLSEVARLAPANRVGAITGAFGFVTFGGVMAGPPVFALIAALTDSYRYGFVTFGSLAAGSGVWLLARRKK